MTWVATAVVAGSVITGKMGADAAEDVSDDTIASNKAEFERSQEIREEGLEDVKDLLNPYMKSEKQGLRKLNKNIELMKDSGYVPNYKQLQKWDIDPWEQVSPEDYITQRSEGFSDYLENSPVVDDAMYYGNQAITNAGYGNGSGNIFSDVKDFGQGFVADMNAMYNTDYDNQRTYNETQRITERSEMTNRLTNYLGLLNEKANPDQTNSFANQITGVVTQTNDAGFNMTQANNQAAYNATAASNAATSDVMSGATQLASAYMLSNNNTQPPPNNFRLDNPTGATVSPQQTGNTISYNYQ